MPQAFVLDSTAEDASNTQLDIHDSTNYRVLHNPEWPAPQKQPTWAQSSDTFGESLVNLHYQNREIKLKVRCYGASAAALEANMTALEHKVEKVNRETGTLRWTSPAGRVFTFDLLTGNVNWTLGPDFNQGKRAEAELSFTALPGARGAEVTHSDNIETTLPVIKFTVTGIKGPLGAYARLVIDDDEGRDQWFLQWGQQQRFYDSATSADLFYQAEGRTVLSGASTTADTAASAGSCVQHTNLNTSYQAILSTQATGGGNHFSHIGQFDVWARMRPVSTNTGTVKVRLEWAAGDYKRRTRNSEVELLATGSDYGRYSLGQVTLSKVVAGTQRWEGRILAKSTIAGDDVRVDCLWLVPVAEGSGQARVSPVLEAPTSYLAQDDFGFTDGTNLAGRVAPTGGTWAGAGDTDDFKGTGTTSEIAVDRESVSDTEARIAYLSTNYTNVTVETALGTTATTTLGQSLGVVARVNSASPTSNHLVAYLGTTGTSGSVGWRVFVYKVVSGVSTQLGFTSRGTIAPFGSLYQLRLTVDDSGRWLVWFGLYGTDLGGVPALMGQDAALATGGALATGRVGLYDHKSTAGAARRVYDAFWAATPTTDAVIYANQSAEVRHDRAVREDSAGTTWTRQSRYEGDYLKVNPAGNEGRTTRFLVTTCANDPYTMADTVISNVSARLYTTPLYGEIPEA